MAEMTPRERVLAAINHQEPDRVPLDIGGGSSTSIVVEGFENLKQYLGVSGETQGANKIFRVARLDERVMQRLGSDCRPLGIWPPSRWKPPPPPEPATFLDLWGIMWRQADYGNGCYYWELARNPLAQATIEDLERYPWPDPLDPGFTAGLAEKATGLHEETDHAIMADGGFKSYWELGYMLRGFGQMLMDLAPGGGYVVAPVHNIQPDVSPQNIVAMAEATREFGAYPLAA